MKYSSCDDIFDYLQYISELPDEYLYLLKRNTNIFKKSIDINIRRIKLKPQDLSQIKSIFTGFPSSISDYLWDKGEPINEVKERIIKKTIKGVVLDIDRFNNYMKKYIWKLKI